MGVIAYDEYDQGKPKQFLCWTTDHELEFLDNIGGYRFGKDYKLCSLTRLSFLRRYRDGMALRCDWARINESIVKDHLEDLISKLEYENG